MIMCLDCINIYAKSFARFAVVLFFIALSSCALNAKEPSSWFVGVGGGYGLTQTDKKYSNSAKSNGMNIGWVAWNNQVDSHYINWGFTFESLVGYKHFLNDYIGLRYYANVGAQFYKNPIFTSNKNKIGVIDYTLNADLLLNLYTSPDFSFGIFGGFGVGGAYFDSPELTRWENNYGAATDSTQYTEEIFAGVGKVYRNHINASLSTGLRINFFQQIRGAGQMVCSADGDGRRSCKKPTAQLEHSIEVNAKFPMLTYRLTTPPEVMGRICRPNEVNQGYKCIHLRGSYKIKTPYKFTLRYILAF